MSRKWKALPTHLPGWGREYESFLDAHLYARSKRKSKSRKRLRFRGSRSRVSRCNESKPAKPSHPLLYKTLRIQLETGVVGACFLRRDSKWRCIKAAPAIAWFTRASIQSIENWIRLKKYPFQWVNPTTDAAASIIASDEHPSGYYCRNGAVDKQTQSVAHVRPDAPVSNGPEQNGVITSSLLNASA